MFRLRTEIFPCPHLSMQLWIVDERFPFFCSFLHHLGSELLLSHAKEHLVIKVIPEDTDARHLLVKRLHVCHLLVMFFL